MDSAKQANVPFHEAALKAKVAQICESVGFNAITQDSSNILVDIYRRTIHHLARHCKDAANSNRRTEPTIVDLVRAYDFVGISIPELQEHVETVKLPLNFEISRDESKPSNRIQRNLLVDDLLEADKNNHLEEADESEEEKEPTAPLLKDVYEEISKKFEAASVTADKKLKLSGRIVLVANNTKVKISAPIPPTMVETPAIVEAVKPLKASKKITKGRGGTRKKLKTNATPPETVKKEPKSKKRREKTSSQFAIVSETVTEPLLNLEELERIENEPIPPMPKDVCEDIPEKFELEQVLADKKSKLSSRITPDVIDTKVKISTPLPPESSAKAVISPKEEEKKKNKRKKRSSDELPISLETVTPKSSKKTVKSKEAGNSKKKLKVTTTPVETSQPQGKNKKKSNNQFAIVTETVTATQEDKEWLCPACGGPDDGDLMVQCDTCEEWFHLGCTDLKKPPVDDENWECDICLNKAKTQKRAPAPQVEAVVKLKTPELVVKTPPPPPAPAPAPTSEPTKPAIAGTSQDDLCPECNLPDDGTLMIQCEDPDCAKWFHGKCVNLLEAPTEEDSWFCKVCIDRQQSAFKRRRRAK